MRGWTFFWDRLPEGKIHGGLHFLIVKIRLPCQESFKLYLVIILKQMGYGFCNPTPVLVRILVRTFPYWYLLQDDYWYRYSHEIAWNPESIIIHISWCSRSPFFAGKWIPIVFPGVGHRWSSVSHRMLPIWGEHQQSGEDLVGPLALDTLHGAFHAAVGGRRYLRPSGDGVFDHENSEKTVENAWKCQRYLRMTFMLIFILHLFGRWYLGLSLHPLGVNVAGGKWRIAQILYLYAREDPYIWK